MSDVGGWSNEPSTLAAFALAFVPPWVAFRRASHWRACLAVSASLRALAYILAFTTALVWDPPFGPTLVVVLMALTGPAMVRGRVPRWRLRPRSAPI